MTVWHTAQLKENRAIAPGLHLLTVDVPQAISSGFHNAGQYHRVRVKHGEDAWFAIASPPGQSPFQYLVRESEGAAGAWVRSGPGAELELTAPEGPGFPVEAARGRSLVLIGTGTGFAPLWSVVQVVRARRHEFKSVHALYGVISPEHLAWSDSFAALASDGIVVEPVIERPAPGWAGLSGRVQAHVARLPTDDSFAFLCGHPAMVSDVTRLLGERGVTPDRVFLNVDEALAAKETA